MRTGFFLIAARRLYESTAEKDDRLALAKEEI
jgi:hypothetical protein